jgi:hypothetical protein
MVTRCREKTNDRTGGLLLFVECETDLVHPVRQCQFRGHKPAVRPECPS